MPFTPFHFGVGIAARAALARRFSLTVFIVLQVLTDLESLYNLVYRRVPVHRFLHTFLGATVLAAAFSGTLWAVLSWWSRRSGRGAPAARVFGWLLATALFATWSHVVLDGVMHQDVQPFWPLTEVNPFLFVVSRSTLHLGCAVFGFFGLVVLGLDWALRAERRS